MRSAQTFRRPSSCRASGYFPRRLSMLSAVIGFRTPSSCALGFFLVGSDRIFFPNKYRKNISHTFSPFRRQNVVPYVLTYRVTPRGSGVKLLSALTSCALHSTFPTFYYLNASPARRLEIRICISASTDRLTRHRNPFPRGVRRLPY